MSLHALEDLDDALDATRAFLWPIDRSRWLKLAVVVFFVGGPGANLNAFQFNVPAGDGTPPGGLPAPPGGLPTPGGVGPNVLFVVGAVVAAVLLVALALLFVGSVMEFVLVESLRREEVLLRRFWGEHWRRGVRLFGFRLVVGLLVFGSAAVLAVLFVLPVVVDVTPGPAPPVGGASIVALLLLVPVAFVLALVVGLANGFTTVFVVPIMILEACGVLDGWRRLWSTIVARPWQYLAYAVASFVLSIVGGVLVAILLGVAALVLLIPFGILGAVGLLLLTTVPPFGVGVLALVVLLFVLSLFAVAALVQVPVVTYLRYYALLVLGDVDADLDLVADRRAAIRADDPDGTGGAGA